jgi:hypothetical protein
MFNLVVRKETAGICRHHQLMRRSWSITSDLQASSQNCEKRLLASSCLYVCPQETTRLPLDSFSWNLISEYFSKIYGENSSFIITFNNNRYFTYRPIYIYDNISLLYLQIKNISNKCCTENQNILWSITFFWKSCVYEIIWQNIVEPERPQMTIRRMRIACFIRKAKNTPSK